MKHIETKTFFDELFFLANILENSFFNGFIYTYLPMVNNYVLILL